MRIQACTPLGNKIRLVWHCEQCRKVNCEWVDTDTAQYMEVSRFENVLVQARAIVFDEQQMTVYINPVDDPQENYIDQLSAAV